MLGDFSSSVDAIAVSVAGTVAVHTPLNPNHYKSNMSQQSYSAHIGLMNSSRGSSNGEVLAQVEALIICGCREDAADLAARSAEWGLAILVSSLCSPEKYKEIVSRYSEQAFPVNSTLSIISRLFSNQPLNTIADNIVDTASSSNESSFMQNWRRNAAAIIANKNVGWEKNLTALADKLHNDFGDIMAAHFLYLASGLLPTAPSPTTKFSLIGHNYATDKRKSFLVLESIFSFRLTEIIEWICVAAINTLKSKPGENVVAGSVSSSGIVRSLSGMFGLSIGASASPSLVTGIDTGIGSDHIPSTNELNLLNEQHVHDFQVAFAPQKLRFSMLCADLGLIRESFEYCKSIRELINCTEEGNYFNFLYDTNIFNQLNAI